MPHLLWLALAASAQAPADLPEPADAPADPEPADPEPADPEETADEAAKAAYSAQVEEVAGLAPDEEAAAWEQFLADHPDSPFAARIRRRIDELLDALHDERIPEGPEGEPADPHVRLSPTLLLENLEPRTRVFGGFEWGLPDHTSLNAGVEVAPHRNLSAIAQIRRRFITGWSVEGGLHPAPVVSRDLGLVVAILADARVNVDGEYGTYVALRPQVGVGKTIAERFEVQGLVGGDGELREAGGVTWIVGAHGVYRLAAGANLFLEATSITKHPAWPGGALNYTNVTGGIRFLLGPRDRRDAADAFVAAWYNLYRYYWNYGQGAVVVRTDAYLDDLAAR